MEKSIVDYNKDRSKLLTDLKFQEEELEVVNGQFTKTGFPKALKTYRLSWELYDLSMEEPYFWFLDTLKDANPIVEKLEDSFAAAENSAFFGVTQQRLGAQQDKVSQYLATSGKMVKELFQMIRELRILDERLAYYDDANKQVAKKIEQRGKSAEITLKGIFIDLVQGGGKSAASVYGMARELEFITLPDLFFDAPPFKDVDELEKHVKNLEKDFNASVLRVLERHLRQFYEWKTRTHSEHAARKGFMLQYLLQHFEIIKMYINWIKPYLRHVGKLSFKSKNMVSPDLVSAFEGSMLDIEFLARKRDEKTGMNGCVLASFFYRTRPELKVVQEGYQRGPVHIGKMEVYLRAYTWDDKQVEAYKKLKDQEAMMLLGDVSESVRGAMEALGGELDKYLEEARVKVKQDTKEEKKEEKQKSFMQSFLGEFYRAPQKKLSGEKKLSASEARKMEEAKEKAKKDLKAHALGSAWGAYNYFKKSHRMITW